MLAQFRFDFLPVGGRKTEEEELEHWSPQWTVEGGAGDHCWFAEAGIPFRESED